MKQKKHAIRRFEFSEIQTASMWMAGNRDIAFPRDSMKAWLPWILCGVLMLMVLGLGELLSLPTTTLWVPISICTVRCTYGVWVKERYCWSHILENADERCLHDAENRYAHTYWVEGDFFYDLHRNSKSCVWLGNFRELRFRRDLVVLTTGRKWEPAYVFHRASLADDQWRELCALIQAANAKFSHPYQSKRHS